MSEMRGKDSLEYGEENAYFSIEKHKDPWALSRPWPQLHMACFTHMTPLHYISKFWPLNIGDSFAQPWSRTSISCNQFCPSQNCFQDAQKNSAHTKCKFVCM